MVDEEGVFRITTYKHGDGAPAGKYRATVYWQKRGRGDNGETIPLGRYSEPAMSPLLVEVKEEPNALAAFQLQRD